MTRKKVYLMVALLVFAIAATMIVPATAQGLVTYALIDCSSGWNADWSCNGIITVNPTLPDGSQVVEGCQPSVIAYGDGQLLICHYQYNGDLYQNWLVVTQGGTPLLLLPFLDALETLTEANAALTDGLAQSVVVKLEQTKAQVVARRYLPASHTLAAVASEVDHVKGDTDPDFLPVGLMRDVAAVLEKAEGVTPPD